MIFSSDIYKKKTTIAQKMHITDCKNYCCWFGFNGTCINVYEIHF